MHKAIGKDEWLAQSIRILISETLTVEASIGGVYDAVMIWAKDHDIPLTSGPPRERYWMWWLSEKATL